MYRITWMLACLCLLLTLERWLPAEGRSRPTISANGEPANWEQHWGFNGGFQRNCWFWPGRGPIVWDLSSGPRWWDIQYREGVFSEHNVENVHGKLYRYYGSGEAIIELSTAGYEIQTGFNPVVVVERGAVLDDRAVERWFRAAKVDFSDP